MARPGLRPKAMLLKIRTNGLTDTVRAKSSRLEPLQGEIFRFRGISHRYPRLSREVGLLVRCLSNRHTAVLGCFSALGRFSALGCFHGATRNGPVLWCQRRGTTRRCLRGASSCRKSLDFGLNCNYCMSLMLPGAVRASDVLFH